MKTHGSLIHYLSSHPTAANLLMIIFIFAGLFVIYDIRRETLPNFTPTEVEITTDYPGATAEDVESAICQRIEDALDCVSNIDEIRSEARENQGRVVVKMSEGGDINRFLNDVKIEVEAIDDFPEEAEKPIVKQLGNTDMVVSIAITGPMSVPHLKIFCKNVKKRLLMGEKVSLVDIKGFSDHQIRVELSKHTLMQYGINVKDIADIISQQSVDLPSGTIETKESEILIRFADERRSVRELEDLVVFSGLSGAEVRLREIANIKDCFELEEEKILFKSKGSKEYKRAGILQINKTKTEDCLKIMDAVEEFVDKERKSAPPDVEFTITQNVSKVVRDRLSLLVINGLEGFILVFLSLWLFFSIRLSFWVSMGLPVSFLGTIFIMHIIGFSLNMITMMGLVLALGLIMDDSIVISENVALHLKQGKKALAAAVDGTLEVGAGVISSFLTTVIVFLPLAVLMKGDIGKVLWVMPVVLILTLSTSLIEAFCILPNHLTHSLKLEEGKKKGRIRTYIDSLIDGVTENVLGKSVDWTISWRYLFVGLVVGAFFVSLGMITGGTIKYRAFPDIDGDVLQAHILLPQGTPLSKSEGIVKQVADALERVNKAFTPLQPGKESLIQNVHIHYNHNMDANENGAHVAMVSVDLLGAEERNASIDDITNRWRQEVGDIPDVINITYKEPSIGPAGLPIDIRLKGEDLDEMKRASIELMNWLNSYEGVLDLKDDLRPGKPEIKVKLQKGAMFFGVNAMSVASQLRSDFYGKKVSEVHVGSESYEIYVRLASQDRASMANLETFYVKLNSGEKIPLNSIAVMEQSRGYARINRINSIRTISIKGDVDTRVANSAEIINETIKKFLPGLKDRYPDIDILMEGEAKESAKTGSSMLLALIVGVFGIFVILSFQFKSYIEPLIVMAAIPLSFIGVVWGHYFMKMDISMLSMIGFVSLAGVVVNDSILLVEFLKMRTQEGKDVLYAARMSSRDRFRAVMLTSLTTIAGLLPILSEKSLQAQLLIPLAVSFVFGLTASTILVLIMIPALYIILVDMGMTVPKNE